MNEAIDGTVHIHFDDDTSGSVSSIESSLGRERKYSEERISELETINRSLTYAVQVRLLSVIRPLIISSRF